jgi:hypothetical protein
MTILRDLGAELVGMFIGNRRLTFGVLAIVATTGLSINFAGLEPLVGGALLLLGCPVLLIENVRRSSGLR